MGQVCVLVAIAALAPCGASAQTSERAASAATGSIVGIVVNERHEPVARALVQAFPATAPLPEAPPPQTEPLMMRASGSAQTDPEGHFRIPGLQPGEYVLAAEPQPFLDSNPFLSAARAVYARTFYPSTTDGRKADRVSASAVPKQTVVIGLVRVRGGSISGSVASPSGQSAVGMSVGLYHRFGGFGSGHEVAVVRDDGTFETIPVAPGWYQLSVEKRSTTPNEDRGEFVEKTIQVQDRDLEGLSLVLGRGASISGRVVLEGGLTALAPGLRIAAESAPQQFSKHSEIYARVKEDLSFQMVGLSGISLFTVRADRPPMVMASRIMVDRL